ncbi:MAG: hypothetical protein A2020_02375 [Lentisphaerae bacterium GWF2_45_14]|nr:MAG: hypothetical protein A2020_02375 [Lentisphaerae bacterium GWF2_45_14]
MHQLLVLGEKFQENMEKALVKQGYSIAYAETEDEILSLIKSSPPDVILTDYSSDPATKLDIQEKIRSSYEDFIKFIAVLPEKREPSPEIERAKKISNESIRNPLRPRDMLNILVKVVYGISE